jgi:hypothetical protein
MFICNCRSIAKQSFVFCLRSRSTGCLDFTQTSICTLRSFSSPAHSSMREMYGDKWSEAVMSLGAGIKETGPSKLDMPEFMRNWRFYKSAKKNGAHPNTDLENYYKFQFRTLGLFRSSNALIPWKPRHAIFARLVVGKRQDCSDRMARLVIGPNLVRHARKVKLDGVV